MTVPCTRAFDTLAELEAHIAAEHPDVLDEMDRWPDGRMAGPHDALTPEHFTGERP